MTAPWTWALGEIVMTCVDIVYFFLLPGFQMAFQRWVKATHVISYALFSIIAITIYNYLTANSISVIFLSITLFSIYTIVFINGKWLLKLFWLTFPFALLYGSELTSFYIITHIYPQISIDVFALPNIYRIQMLIFSKTLQISLLIFLLNFKLELEKLNHVVSASVLLSSISIVFGLIGHLIGFAGFDGPTAQAILLRFAITFLFINICYFSYLLFNTYRAKQHYNILNRELKIKQIQLDVLLDEKLQQQQADLKLKNYEELVAAHEMFKNLQTEVKENLQSLQSLASADKIPQLEAQLARFFKMTHQFNRLYQTGDAVLDTVLSSKEAEAAAHHIQLQATVSLPPPKCLNSFDIGTILINLLDNAIEAFEKLDNTTQIDHSIQLNMAAQNDCYKIKIQNPINACNQPVKNTGLGLKIVKELVNKYQGSLQIAHQDHFFTVIIVLPLNQTDIETI